jgi:hypothetical protein
MRLNRTAGRGIVIVATLAAAVAIQAAAQSIGSYERGRGRDMLRVVRDRLEQYYYDSTFHGVDLASAAARADSQIRVAGSNVQIARSIAAFVETLGDSHTRFYPPYYTAEFTYGWALQMIGDSCFVVRVDSASDAAAQGLEVGDRVIAMDQAEPTRGSLPRLEHSLFVVAPQPAVHLEVERPTARAARWT